MQSIFQSQFEIWTIDVQASIIANCYLHYKIRFMNNMAFEDLNRCLDYGGIPQLCFLNKEWSITIQLMLSLF
jgi:hypothetical protein